jgi:FkbM family methyltransferase
LDHKHDYAVFIDSGSCIGDYSILLSKYNIRCIAFEPLPGNYEVLVKNLQLNNLTDKVMTIPAALGDDNKMVKFTFNQVNTGASHFDTEDHPESFPVELRTFDSLLTKLNIGKDDNVLFKLDVEGMESEALRGAANFIRQYPHITFIIEEKFTEMVRIKTILNELGTFEYGMVDEFNMFARKT